MTDMAHAGFVDPDPIPAVLPPLLAGGRVAQYDNGKFALRSPGLAKLIEYGSIHHIIPSTIGSYNTAIKQYCAFCKMEGLDPWPVDEVKLAGFIHFVCLSISTSSINVYVAGVRYGHENAVPEPWPLEDNELIRRTKRFVKRRYPSRRALAKLLISLRVLRIILGST